MSNPYSYQNRDQNRLFVLDVSQFTDDPTARQWLSYYLNKVNEVNSLVVSWLNDESLRPLFISFYKNFSRALDIVVGPVLNEIKRMKEGEVASSSPVIQDRLDNLEKDISTVNKKLLPAPPLTPPDGVDDSSAEFSPPDAFIDFLSSLNGSSIDLDDFRPQA